MSSKLDRLFSLLETGSTNATRRAAAQQIGSLVKTHPHELPILLERVTKYLQHKEWETRVAAGLTVEYLAENVNVWNPAPEADPTLEVPNMTDKLSFASFSVQAVMKNGTPLLASGGQEFDFGELEKMPLEERLAFQQKQINEKLGFFISVVGSLVDSKDLIAPAVKVEKNLAPPTPVVDSDLAKQIKELEATLADPEQSSRQKNTARRKLKELKKKKESSTSPMSFLRTSKQATKQVVTAQPQQDTKIVIEAVRDNDKALEDSPHWPFHYFTSNLLNNLFDPNWEVRHGAAIGIRDLLKRHASGAGKIKLAPTAKELKLMNEQYIKDIQAYRNQKWLEDCAIRLICVLALDRFGDYGFDNAIAPVRETAAQALGMVMRHVPKGHLSIIIEALSCLEASAEWQVRQSGFLGLKYLITVWSSDEVIATEILNSQLPAIISGLQDLEDDVRLVAADCLLPVVDILVKLKPEHVSNAIITLWDAFLEIDDLTASTTSVTKLLSLIYAKVKPGINIAAAQSLSKLVPRLWPFFRHNILAVRKGVVTTLLQLVQNSNCRTWVEPILDSFLKLTFQNIVLDVDESVVEMSFELWRSLVESVDSHTLQMACVNDLAKWFSILNTANGSPIPREHLLVVCHSNSLGGSDTGIPLCDKRNADPAMRIIGSQCLGILASKWQSMLLGGQQVNHMHAYFTQLLTTGSATSRQVAAVALSSIVEQVMRVQSITGQQQTISVSPEIVQHLNYMVHNPHQQYWDELAPSLQALRSDCVVLLDSFKNLGVPTTKFFAQDLGNSFVTPENARALALQAYPSMLGYLRVDQGVIDQLSARQLRVLERIPQVDELQKSLGVAVMASICESMIQFGTLPENLNILVDPILESLAAEKTYQLQKRSAKALSLLMSMSLSRSDNPSSAIIDRLVKFLAQKQTVPVEEPETIAVETVQGDGLRSSRKRKVNYQALDEASAALDSNKKTRAGQATDRPVDSFDYEYRGAQLAFVSLAEEFKETLFASIPRLNDTVMNILLEYEQRKSQGTLDQTYNQAVSVSLNLLIILIPVLTSPEPLSSMLDRLLPQIILSCTHSDAEISKLGAEALGIACKKSPVKSMQLVIEKMLPLFEKQDDLHARLGVCGCLRRIIETLGLDILPWVVFLIIPILGRMSDPDRQVRERVTFNFATLVKLMPLESSIPDPPGLDPALVQQKIHERHFLEQLLDGNKLDDYDLPIKIDATLRSYQKEGVNWLAFLNKYNLHGILCDDMGLGKTLQAICILASDDIRRRERWEQSHNEADIPLPSLVICPSTLVSHWEAEIEKFCQDRVKTLRYVGNPTDRKRLRDRASEVSVVITSYEVVRNDSEFFADPKRVWNYCILDEGHIIKNPKAKLSVAVKNVRALHRLILSGTPIQNNVLELWSLFDFLMPGFLGQQAEFSAMYSKPILASRDAKSSSDAQEAGVLAMEALHRQVLPFILRRLKEDVLHDLPPKIIQDYHCEMSALQKKLYHHFTSNNQDIIKTKDSTHVFQALQYLRKLCSDPQLVLTTSHPQYKHLAEELKSSKDSLDDIKHSPKLLALKELLNECGIGKSDESNNETLVNVAGHRVLIFCQLRGMIDIIENKLFKAHMPDVTYLRMDGQTPAQKRVPMVKQFNEDPTIDCFLLTTSVGGLGLNLTGADTVIFMEHDWNPMKDLQAMDRAHRIGATRTVNVYRLITLDTLEEKIMSLQKFKLQTANSIVNAENQSFSTMDTSILLDLFKMSTDSNDTTTSSGVDSLGNVTVGAGAVGGGAKALLEGLGDLWDESQYTDEFDLDNFVKGLK
eukprot:TRINITY_DN15340_c0_g1_i1.p1 TRINITY_DN15340_c0_g1~~TRINITY_DN15340_c0_g1_i1.p1  ORF type:complete len:1800 (+),score=296.36 TRINITY_DN15340_c0_g1_i1:48-5447(+)